MGSVLGVAKIAAGRVGLSLEQYQAQVSKGLKWCFRGRHWQPVSEFHTDRSRGDGLKAVCKPCLHRPLKEMKLPAHSLKIQSQASSAVSYQVRKGLMPNVSTLQCSCGAGAKHYHHYKGYAKENWLDVVPLCRSCHKKAHWE